MKQIIGIASVAMATLTGIAQAGANEVGMIRGVGYAMVVVEKCTGVAPASDYVQLLRAGMIRNGIQDDDFRQGFASGAMKAEMKFQGKPPTKECKDAKALKVQIDKAFL